MQMAADCKCVCVFNLIHTQLADDSQLNAMKIARQDLTAGPNSNLAAPY